jgi:3-dehydroquinate synthase
MKQTNQTVRVNLAERAKVTHVVLLTDDNVQNPHAIEAAESLGEKDIPVDVISVDPGEPSKSIEVANALWQAFLEVGADRKTIVVAVGGGVIGDLAGFIAATYARGLRFLQVPTTLLAQVDSSVGGKVGINLPDAKNMVGAFLQPIGVLIDPTTLTTLPENEYRAGLGEVVKYGVILDEDLFSYLEAHVQEIIARDPNVLSHVIARCCRLKADVVEKDEREETGLRAILNFGHTYGHAFETLLGYGNMLHGEAVSVGMVCATRLAQQLDRVDMQVTERLVRLLQAFELPIDVPELDHDEIAKSMMHDKKVQHGTLHFVLPTRIGHVELVNHIAPEDILVALKQPE